MNLKMGLKLIYAKTKTIDIRKGKTKQGKSNIGFKKKSQISLTGFWKVK